MFKKQLTDEFIYIYVYSTIFLLSHIQSRAARAELVCVCVCVCVYVSVCDSAAIVPFQHSLSFNWPSYRMYYLKVFFINLIRKVICQKKSNIHI